MLMESIIGLGDLTGGDVSVVNEGEVAAGCVSGTTFSASETAGVVGPTSTGGHSPEECVTTCGSGDLTVGNASVRCLITALA